ncbi:MAG: plasmid pRiA4b ORF-3 family protein [Clostridia bacterium]|nr:plasmid pRiA4b ORF-3 family protein [Clostridia bacterium]
MKAYQPPIWRRIIVPAGLSFAQFTLIVNSVFEWDGYHLSEYYFRKANERISNDSEGDDSISGFGGARRPCREEFLQNGSKNSLSATKNTHFGDAGYNFSKMALKVLQWRRKSPDLEKFCLSRLFRLIAL